MHMNKHRPRRPDEQTVDMKVRRPCNLSVQRGPCTSVDQINYLNITYMYHCYETMFRKTAVTKSLATYPSRVHDVIKLYWLYLFICVDQSRRLYGRQAHLSGSRYVRHAAT